MTHLVQILRSNTVEKCAKAEGMEGGGLPEHFTQELTGSPSVSRGVSHPPAWVWEIWWPSQPEGGDEESKTG